MTYLSYMCSVFMYWSFSCNYNVDVRFSFNNSNNNKNYCPNIKAFVTKFSFAKRGRHTQHTQHSFFLRTASTTAIICRCTDVLTLTQGQKYIYTHACTHTHSYEHTHTDLQLTPLDLLRTNAYIVRQDAISQTSRVLSIKSRWVRTHIQPSQIHIIIYLFTVKFKVKKKFILFSIILRIETFFAAAV